MQPRTMRQGNMTDYNQPRRMVMSSDQQSVDSSLVGQGQMSTAYVPFVGSPP